MPKGRVETPITDQEIAFAHLVMAGTMTDRDAAKAVGISSSQAAYVKAKPRVKAYMDQHRATVAAAIAEHESESPVELNINRKTIMARYWELSQLPCSDTNGSIAGQVRALDSLREMLGLMGVFTYLTHKTLFLGSGRPASQFLFSRYQSAFSCSGSFMAKKRWRRLSYRRANRVTR